ncbi:MAG: hypothetical protein Q8S04_01610 [Bacteroidales bacterium]|nr:hypothetical protein [Bacteroidales bacterium]
MLIRTMLYALLIVSFAGLTSCEKKPVPIPEPQPAKYTIKGQVLSQQTNAPLAGVLVSMGILSQTTNATGSFEFKDLTTAGKYTLAFTKADFFNANYSIEFQAAPLNSTLTYNISVTMVPFVPGVTPITPASGGTINITGTTPATLTIPAGTTVTDKNGVAVTGSINITAVKAPDIVSGTVNNPGVAVFRFEPSGLQFSNPLPLVVNNPLTGYRFTNIRLEFYNETLGQWEIKTQPVTYNTSTNKYGTTINHFSVYKLATDILKTYLGATLENVTVVNNSIENRSLLPVTITSIQVQRKNGYKFDPAITTALTAKGITGADATALKTWIEDAIKPYYGNNSAITDLVTVNENIGVSRVIMPDNKLVTTGVQAIDSDKYVFSVTTPAGVTILVDIIVKSARAVALTHEDMHYTHGTHGGGGGGTN